jgi:L-2-amino-thiazoline-4-carboxylic acid hydrolase
MYKKQVSKVVLHKFDQPLQCPLTRRQRVELEYASHFIPYLKILEKIIGRDKVIESLQELAYQETKRVAEELVKGKGKNDLSLFKEIYDPENPENQDLLDILTWEVGISTDEIFEVKVTECLLADVFLKAGVGDYGYAAVCSDVLFTKLVNPQILLNLEGTMMQGKSCCMHCFYVEPKG